MQQTFQCYKCGSQNYIGKPYCYNCQSPFLWNCPNCRATVQNTMVSCPNCRIVLPWTNSEWINSPIPVAGSNYTNRVFMSVNTSAIKQEKHGLRIGALIVGIIGSIAGILIAALILFIAGAVTIVGAIADSMQGTTNTGPLQATGIPIAVRSLLVLLISLIGITGSSLSIAKPRLAAVLMIITGIGGFFLASWLWLFSGVLLIVGSIMALWNWLREKIDGVGRSNYQSKLVN